ncbi:MAG TPA: hypothetical protein VLE73_04795 [Candidatus Saccharimonadales bacterium]|nr:hypothetical protein [Candidatus Saccharimonadales bacterium]
MTGLEGFSTQELLGEILKRPDSDMIKPGGFVYGNAYPLLDKLGTRVCVDGAPVRYNDRGDVELMAILRGTGKFAGKLCLVGGGVQRKEENGNEVPESLKEALERHFMTDLGVGVEAVGSWDRPHMLAQDMREVDGEVRPGFFRNPASRHLIAARWLVKLKGDTENMVFGSTEVGGQEALDTVWFTKDDMPESDAFGYNHDITYRHMFDVAHDLAARHALPA